MGLLSGACSASRESAEVTTPEGKFRVWIGEAVTSMADVNAKMPRVQDRTLIEAPSSQLTLLM